MSVLAVEYDIKSMFQASDNKEFDTIAQKISNTEGGFSQYLSQRITITGSIADYTVDLGELTQFNTIVLVASNDLDAVYFSDIVSGKKIAENTHFLAMTGLSGETTIHIDASGITSDTTIDILLVGSSE